MSRRSRPVRLARNALWVFAFAQVGQAAVLRLRRTSVPDLPPLPGLGAPEEGAAQGSAGAAFGSLPKRSDFRSLHSVDVLAMADTDIDEVTLAEVADLMERTGVEVIDLVPGDLPAERALRWLRRVDPAKLSTDPTYSPGGAHEALALHPDVVRRMAEGGAGGAGGFDRGTFVRRTVTAQRYAAANTAVRIAPRLAASASTPKDRWRELQEVRAGLRPHGEVVPVVIALDAAKLAALTLGPLVSPLAGLAALLAWSAQPALVLGGQAPGASGTAAVPADLVEASVARLVRGWTEVAEAIGAYGELRPPARTSVPAPPPASELFEDRIEACPWCGATALVGRLDTPDLFQHKPGTFHLDECTACGHIFQNPRLSIAGLDHYYDQFYDGFGEEQWERAFAAMTPQYDGRVEIMASLTEPQAWLDVGTGHGHFCLVARQRWPKTRFEGLDLSGSVLEAERRGWIDRAHHGQFPDLAPGLAGDYDVLSMHHYLEHTREPREELAAAAQVLPPGGYLLIEGPDPASPWARMGRYWRCWFQPQHQHFITCENLMEELEAKGFEVVSVQRAEAGEGADLAFAAVFVTQRLSGRPRLPWLAEPTPAQRAWRPVGIALGLPLVAAALLVDLVKDGWDKRPGSTTPGNAYRIVARRR